MKILEFIIAILPGILIALYIYFQDKEREEPLPLILSFVLGILITIPARWIEKIAYEVGLSESENFLLTVFVAFIVVAFNEELFKFGLLLLYPFRKSFFDEKFDGIVYGVMIGMGFATLENILYVNMFGLEGTWVRAFTAVPSHGVYGIIMGYYFGLAKFSPPRQRRIYLIKGLVYAFLLHGIYDLFLIQQESDWLMLLSLVVLYGSFYISWRMIREHQMQPV